MTLTPQDEYILGILRKYNVFSGEILYAQMNPFLVRWAGRNLERTFISGSSAKGTAVKGSADVDIFISLRADTQETLGEIYESLYQLAFQQAWFPKKQDVSIGIQYLGSKVDLVPGRIQPGHLISHSLFRNRARTWTQTNVDRHIQIVKNSGRLNEIRAIKVWRNLRGLEFPSLCLELTVIEALKYRPITTLAANVLAALEYIAENIARARVVDPGNSNNILSNDLSVSEKQALATAAQQSLRATNWNQIIW